MLLARQVSRTCRALIEESSTFKRLRNHPVLMAKLDLPFVHSISSPSSELPKLHVYLVLQSDRPVTVRQARSPLSGVAHLLYNHEQNASIPQPFPRFPDTSAFSGSELKFNRNSDPAFIELKPGTPFRLSLGFHSRRYPSNDLWPGVVREGLTELEAGNTDVVGVKPGVTFPGAYIGSKSSLHNVAAGGDSLEGNRFHATRSDEIVRQGALGKALSVVGEDTVLLKVTA